MILEWARGAGVPEESGGAYAIRSLDSGVTTNVISCIPRDRNDAVCGLDVAILKSSGTPAPRRVCSFQACTLCSLYWLHAAYIAFVGHRFNFCRQTLKSISDACQNTKTLSSYTLIIGCAQPILVACSLSLVARKSAQPIIGCAQPTLPARRLYCLRAGNIAKTQKPLCHTPS